MVQVPVLSAERGAAIRRAAQGVRSRQRRLGRPLVCLAAAALCWLLLDRRQAASSSQDIQAAFVSSMFAKQAAPPLVALVVGFGLYSVGGGAGTEIAAIVLIYFGAQTGMNFYMKNVLSKIVVDEEEGLKGIPIGFLLTAIQQFVAFFAFCCFLFIGKLFSHGYQVKQLQSRKEYVAVVCFSITFALNIGLNNFSLSLVAISINLIIRSCLPLSTAVSQIIVGSFLKLDGEGDSISAKEWALMLSGVGCAGLATYAKNQAGGSTEDSADLVLGVAVCVASIFSGALNMVLAGVLGTKMKLNPVDTTCYMALPAGLALLIPSLLVSHPMSKWPGFPAMTDWEVLQEVMSRNPWVLMPVAFSGVLAFCYNILQYSLVRKLSAAYAAFAGNFNKAATVALSLALGLEALPAGSYGQLFLLAVLGNIAAFTVFSSLKASSGKGSGH
eukprot:TRINITY_DN38583_c0_g1_i1.p1 TRINITY_DN38583_c0_g1~~TRINITY_DN38583_c0_g1_i1.p1  ORF type:complete len:483 (-),score=102.57 TRINITY_DN38583_c0_g1_i1:62-1387(-)